jgi:predicted Zn-dependent protease
MPTDSKPERSWQEIAEEASHESNPQKLIELSKELEQALEKRREKLIFANVNSCG